jgi:tetratricopeptide (TPR) repeat protein
MSSAPAPTPCVGRADELAWLNRQLDDAVGGAGRVALISAEAGAGKSTLCGHFLAEVAARHPDALVIAATCSEQYGGGEPYQPFVDAFRTLLTPADDEPKRRRGFRDIARELAPHWVAAIPVAGELIAAGMTTATELSRSFGTQQAVAHQAPSEEALFFQYTKLFFAAAEDRPILLFIDDLHWADRASVSLLLHLARRLRDSRVMILGTLRPVDVKVSDHPLQDARQEMQRYGVAEELELAPLAVSDLGELAESLLGAPAEDDLLNWLERHAGTNALFFGELLRWLVQDHYAEDHHGRWRLTRRPEELAIPRSAESTIEKRLARLDPDTYRILEYASVQGNDFLSTALAGLLDMDEIDLEEALEPLERVHRLIRLVDTVDLPDGDFASLYAFSHSLVQDVLHAALKGKRRILLHRRMAEMLEELHREDLSTVAHKLAVHCDEGRLKTKAFGYSMQAADRASNVYAQWDAVELVLRAVRNAPDDAHRARALQRLAEIRWVVGRLPEALEAMKEASAIVEAGDDPARVLTLRRKILLLERDQGLRPPREIAALLHQNVEATRHLGATEELCESLWHLVELEETDRTMDIELATEALALAVELGSDRLIAKGHTALGVALLQDGSPEQARPHLEDALRRYTAIEDLAGAGRSSNCLAIGALMQGNMSAAMAAFEDARGAFRKVGEPLATALVLNNLGVVMIRTGQLERAQALLFEALEIWERLDTRAEFLSPLQNLAELAQLQRRAEEAEQRWRTLREEAFQMGSVDAAVIGECGLGRVRLDRGDVAGAREHLQAAKDRLEDRASWSDAAEAIHLLEAAIAAASGDRPSALELLARAEEALRPRDRYLWAQILTERALLLRQEGEHDDAEAEAMMALEVFNELGAELMAARINDILNWKGMPTWTDESRAAS